MTLLVFAALGFVAYAIFGLSRAIHDGFEKVAISIQVASEETAEEIKGVGGAFRGN